MGKGEHAKVVLTTGTLTGRNAIITSPTHSQGESIPYSFVRFPSLCISAKHQAFSQWERVMKTLSSRRRNVSMDTNFQARKSRRNRAFTGFKLQGNG